jgi:3-keto-L-gulonate-6-phosphate decarboxylase
MVNKFKSLNDNELAVSGGLSAKKILEVVALGTVCTVIGMETAVLSDKAAETTKTVNKRVGTLFKNFKKLSEPNNEN